MEETEHVTNEGAYKYQLKARSQLQKSGFKLTDFNSILLKKRTVLSCWE